MPPAIVTATLLAVFVALQLVGRARNDVRLVWLAKPLASLVFVAVGVARMRPDTAVDLWLVAGLVLGAVGDVLLIPKKTFVVGLLAFLAGHLAYLGAFQFALPVPRWPLLILAPLVLVAAAVARWLWPHLGRLRLPVAAYVVVITAMAWGGIAVAGRGLPWWVAPAAVLFWLSDVAVARDRFVSPGLVNRVLGLPAYSAAQLLLAYAVGS